MADGVHAAVHLMQSPSPNPPLNRALADAGGVQLRGRNHAVLALGELRNRRIATSDEKAFAMKDFSSHDANRPAAGAPHPPR